MNGQRWDNDTRGRGIASGGWIVPGVQRLLSALAEPDWIAEQPGDHLLPGLKSMIDAPGSVWTLVGTSFRDGVYEVNLEWVRAEPSLRLLRADVFALLGGIAEGATFVRQATVGETVEFQATTGLLDGDTPFKGHGHLLLLRIVGPAVRQLHPPHTYESP